MNSLPAMYYALTATLSCGNKSVFSYIACCKWVSHYCLMPTQQFFSYIMVRTS